MRPEKAPLEALAKILAEAQGDLGAWRVWDQRLHGSDAVGNIRELAKDLRVGVARVATVLVPIDQLEELFTIADAEDRDTFLALMAALLDPTADLPILTVAAGRADVLQGLLESGALAALAETLPLCLCR